MEKSDVFLVQNLLLGDLIGDGQRLNLVDDLQSSVEERERERDLHRWTLFPRVDHHRSSGEAFWQLSDAECPQQVWCYCFPSLVDEHVQLRGEKFFARKKVDLAEKWIREEFEERQLAEHVAHWSRQTNPFDGRAKKKKLVRQWGQMEVYPSISAATVDGIALYGHNCTSSHLSRLFSAVGLPVFLLASSENIDRSSLPSNVTFVEERNDLPYLSSVLINCQNDFLSIQSLLHALPSDYRQRMAYVECSSLMREKQLELLHEQMQFKHYLCMNLIELDSSTMIQPHLHLLCSGDELVFGKVLLQSRLPAKLTFLQHTKTPFDSFYLSLFYRYSQAMHLAIYTEFFSILRAGNPIYPGDLRVARWVSSLCPLFFQVSFNFSSIGRR